MTEEEWLTAIDPAPMERLCEIRKQSPRQWMLWACACCRRLGDLSPFDEEVSWLTAAESSACLTAVERFADGDARREEVCTFWTDSEYWAFGVERLPPTLKRRGGPSTAHFTTFGR